MEEMPRVWEERFRVRAYEADARGALSVVALCDWLQEVAGRHASRLGWAIEALRERGITWVLARLAVRWRQAPTVGDEVRVLTWPTGVERLYAMRAFRVADATGGELAAAATAWMLVDLQRRRPVRPSADLEEIARGAPPPALPGTLERLPTAADGTWSTEVCVPWGALDLNRHANNARLVAWLLEPVPGAVRDAGAPLELEVEFRDEARLGDVLAASAAVVEDDPLTLLHRLVRRDDGAELARARSRWLQTA